MNNQIEVILGPRGCGKTHRLIEKAGKDGGYIVCHSHGEAFRIAKRAGELGLSIPFPLTPGELLRGGGPGVKCLHFDNVDFFLRLLSGGIPIRSVTFADSVEGMHEPMRGGPLL